ncbi:nitroreductase family protein [Streptomyces sp. NPDC006978]|uniref:nitroreductase family protein n=1 Tax=unclassified Streptomyces TaxID=2593676 RepID=UPI000CD4C36C|nr:nitroreductase family protein [Streptomyces sp. SM10]
MNNPHDLAAELITALRDPVPALVDRDATRPQPASPAPVPLGPPVRFDQAEGLDHPRASLLTTLERRTSTRVFDPGPVAASLLADVVASGIDADRATWPDEQERCPLQTDIVAFRLDGLEPGMFRLDAGDRAYTPVAPLPDPEALHGLTLQREFCDAAAIISIAADLDRASRIPGAHGYRMLMGRAAAAAYTMWLDAVAAGLVGTVFAGFIPASVRQPLRSDGAARHQLFALALGGAASLPPPLKLPGPTGHR